MSKTNTARKKNGRFKKTKGRLTNREKAILAGSGVAGTALLALTPNPIRRGVMAGGKRVALRVSGTKKRIEKKFDKSRTAERVTKAKEKRAKTQEEIRKNNAVKDFKKSQKRQEAKRTAAAKESQAVIEKNVKKGGFGAAAQRGAQRQVDKAGSAKQAAILARNKPKRLPKETAANVVDAPKVQQGQFRVMKDGRPHRVQRDLEPVRGEKGFVTVPVPGKKGKKMVKVKASERTAARLGPDGKPVPVKGDKVTSGLGEKGKKVEVTQSIEELRRKGMRVRPMHFSESYEFNRTRTSAGTFAPETGAAGPDPLAIRLAYMTPGKLSRKKPNKKRKSLANAMVNVKTGGLVKEAAFSESSGKLKRRRRRKNAKGRRPKGVATKVGQEIQEGISDSAALIRDSAIVEANNAVAQGKQPLRLKVVNGRRLIVLENADPREHRFNDTTDAVISGTKSAGFLVASGGLWQIGSNFFIKKEFDKLPAHLKKQAKKLTKKEQQAVLQSGARAKSAAEVAQSQARAANQQAKAQKPKGMTARQRGRLLPQTKVVSGTKPKPKPATAPNPSQASNQAQQKLINRLNTRRAQHNASAKKAFREGLKKTPVRTVVRAAASGVKRAAFKHPFIAIGGGIAAAAGGAQAIRSRRKRREV